MVPAPTPVTETDQFALHTPVAPTWVLAGEAQDEEFGAHQISAHTLQSGEGE